MLINLIKLILITHANKINTITVLQICLVLQNILKSSDICTVLTDAGLASLSQITDSTAAEIATPISNVIHDLSDMSFFDPNPVGFEEVVTERNCTIDFAVE